MCKYSMLTVDLPDATPERRNLFNESLENKKWVKMGTTTTWIKMWEGELTDQDIVKETHTDVADAAKAGSISIYQAVTTPCVQKPVEWSNGSVTTGGISMSDKLRAIRSCFRLSFWAENGSDI